jgi:hypothetical protein
MQQAKSLIADGLKNNKHPEARFGWIMGNVAEPLAESYSKYYKVSIEAYRTRNGTLSFRNTDTKQRDDAAQAANMTMRNWIAQERRDGAPQRDPVDSLLKAFEKLSAAEQRRFKKSINI